MRKLFHLSYGHGGRLEATHSAPVAVHTVPSAGNRPRSLSTIPGAPHDRRELGLQQSPRKSSWCSFLCLYPIFHSSSLSTMIQHPKSEIFPRPRREPPTGTRFAPAKLKPGGIVDQSCGASAPHRVTDEVTLLRAIPATCPVGTIGTHSLLELLPLARQAGFETATSPIYGVLSCVEVMRALTTAEYFCGGHNLRQSNALPLSYGNSCCRWESNPQPLVPM